MVPATCAEYQARLPVHKYRRSPEGPGRFRHITCTWRVYRYDTRQWRNVTWKTSSG